MMHRKPGTILMLLALFLLSGCISKKKLIYFQDAEPQPKISDELLEFHIKKIQELRIQPYDVLNVNVITESDAINREMNVSGLGQNNNIANSGQGGGLLQGKLVDQDGYLDFPKIGRINVLNLTVSQAELLIEKRLEEYSSSPHVTIRFLSFRVFILGEVQGPGMQSIQNETATLMEVISMAGDLTEMADRKNVMVIRGSIRGSAADPKVFSLDLTSIEAMKSQGYFLKPYDLIYIPPLTRKTLFINLTTLQFFIGLFNTLVALYFLSERLN